MVWIVVCVCVYVCGCVSVCVCSLYYAVRMMCAGMREHKEREGGGLHVLEAACFDVQTGMCDNIMFCSMWCHNSSPLDVRAERCTMSQAQVNIRHSH